MSSIVRVKEGIGPTLKPVSVRVPVPVPALCIPPTVTSRGCRLPEGSSLEIKDNDSRTIFDSVTAGCFDGSVLVCVLRGGLLTLEIKEKEEEEVEEEGGGGDEGLDDEKEEEEEEEEEDDEVESLPNRAALRAISISKNCSRTL